MRDAFRRVMRSWSNAERSFTTLRSAWDNSSTVGSNAKFSSPPVCQNPSYLMEQTSGVSPTVLIANFSVLFIGL